MKYPFPLYELPEGYVLVTDYNELCKLKLYKRKRIPSNLTPRIGMILFVYSEIQDKYYKRILRTYTDRKLLETFIERKVLFYKPVEHGEPQIHKTARRSDFSRITGPDPN